MTTRRTIALLVALPLMACDSPGKPSTPPMKPAATLEVKDPKDDPTQHRTDQPDPEGEKLRAASVARLKAAGFRPAPGLPTALHRKGVPGKLRPTGEIAKRLMALHALNVWVMAPEDRLSNETILAYVQRNDLRSQMTEDELAVLKMTRTQAAAAKGQSMGWTQENMWSLAWMLGFETEPALGAPLIDDRVVEPMLDFLPTVAEGKLADFLKKAKPRSEGEVKAMEDLFYAAHNAARSAQMGDETVVPKGFRPVVEGGAIHERRHSLTWAMSPGVAWDATDLST